MFSSSSSANVELLITKELIINIILQWFCADLIRDWKYLNFQVSTSQEIDHAKSAVPKNSDCYNLLGIHNYTKNTYSVRFFYEIFGDYGAKEESSYS